MELKSQGKRKRGMANRTACVPNIRQKESFRTKQSSNGRTSVRMGSLLVKCSSWWSPNPYWEQASSKSIMQITEDHTPES